MDCTEIHSEIYYSSYLNFCANKCCMAALECMPILSEIAAAVLLNFCAHYMLYDLHKSVRYGLFFLACLKSILLFALGCILSFSKCCLFSQLDLSLALWHLTKDLFSCSLLFSQQECCNFLILGISPRTSWHLTKNLLLSQQDYCCFFFSFSWHLTKSLLASHQDFFNFLPKNGCAHLP
jgi:hypothetical protein